MTNSDKTSENTTEVSPIVTRDKVTEPAQSDKCSTCGQTVPVTSATTVGTPSSAKSAETSALSEFSEELLEALSAKIVPKVLVKIKPLLDKLEQITNAPAPTEQVAKAQTSTPSGLAQNDSTSLTISDFSDELLNDITAKIVPQVIAKIQPLLEKLQHITGGPQQNGHVSNTTQSSHTANQQQSNQVESFHQDTQAEKAQQSLSNDLRKIEQDNLLLQKDFQNLGLASIDKLNAKIQQRMQTLKNRFNR